MDKRFDIALLYVEDDAATREEITSFLRKVVRDVVEAGNGAEGLALFREREPDLVITDIHMPVMDGLLMAEQLRSLNADIPIIALTAFSEGAYLMKAIELGIDRYVIKPVEMPRLTAAIDKCAEVIGHKRAIQKHAEEREALITELQTALTRVKLLSGLLPICAACKKIRDDKGYWNQIESYIHEHSEAEFSHGMCPDCAKSLYPEFYKE